MMKKRTIVYENELEDEFADVKKKETEIGEEFVYINKNPLWRAAAFIVYRLIMTPIAFLHCKLKFSLKVVGKEKLKKAEGGIFVYGNHTLAAGDAYIPNVALFPKKVYVIVRSANLSTFGTKNFIKMSGALPVPTKLSGMRNFLSAIKSRNAENAAIVIYPEAHIWPYYTGIRPFRATSFAYPAKLSSPVYSSTVTYGRKKFGKIPKVTVYIDGPFYPDETLSEKKRAEKLRDEVYRSMTSRAKLSDYAVVNYVKAEGK